MSTLPAVLVLIFTFEQQRRRVLRQRREQLQHWRRHWLLQETQQARRPVRRRAEPRGGVAAQGPAGETIVLLDLAGYLML
ncbi:MAG: hypothetical protein M3P30_13820 [Chloroflexota bacterium]|nr:hypothetical protein [Chloroflexota bacterium]